MRRYLPQYAALLSCCLLLASCATSGTSAGTASSARANEYFQSWPTGASPDVVGKRVAENFLARKFEFEQGKRPTLIYPEIMTWYGSLEVARLTHDTDLQQRLIKRFEPFRTDNPAVNLAHHVDFSVFGAVPLEIFMLTGDSSYLKLGVGFADRQWATPSPNGITSEARYWVDDMYMVSVLQTQAYRATHDRKYLDRNAQAMAAYLDSLQQPSGLLYHGPNTPFYWGRGDGWIAAGMSELLSELPADHPRRARILAGYQKMMATLLEYQSPEGLWRQLLDKPELWLETSGSGMYAFAMVTGVKHGWLDAKTYGPAARRAWLALVSQLDADANVQNVSVGTNVAAVEVGNNLETQYKFYQARDRKTGDLHGQGPMTWTAMALLR
jgi:unsaturated rhamnogalacturonyl hydrolase